MTPPVVIRLFYCPQKQQQNYATETSRKEREITNIRRIWRKEKENLLQQRRKKHGTTIPPPATFIIPPSIKHAAGYHWRRRRREGWEDEETEGEVDEEEVGRSRRSPHWVNLRQLAIRRQKFCFRNSASFNPLPVIFCSLLLFIPHFLLCLFFCVPLPLFPLFLPLPLLPSLLLLSLLLHLNCPSSSPL